MMRRNESALYSAWLSAHAKQSSYHQWPLILHDKRRQRISKIMARGKRRSKAAGAGGVSLALSSWRSQHNGALAAAAAALIISSKAWLSGSGGIMALA
jgi:hypothetical protein